MTQQFGLSAFDLVAAEVEDAIERIRDCTHAEPPRLNDALGACAVALDRFREEPALQLYWVSLVLQADVPWDETQRQVNDSIAALEQSITRPTMVPLNNENMANRFRNALKHCTQRNWYAERNSLLQVAFFHHPHDPLIGRLMDSFRHYKGKPRRPRRGGRNNPQLDR